MRIATWNINGIKARIENLLQWLQTSGPDIVCLQEIKSVDEDFPRLEIESLGYNVETHGQKGFNGVAILSKLKFDEVIRGLPGEPDDVQSRYIEGVFSVGKRVIRVASIYLPNGNPLGTEKFPYKIRWMDRFIAHASDRLSLEEPLVLAGDYNIIPEPGDCFNPKAWEGDALFQPESRQAYRRMKALGLTEAIRSVTDAPKTYTFWDYQAGAWQKNNGIRIDHILMSPEATDMFVGAEIEKSVRSWEKPSDHVPVIVELSE